MTGSAAKVVGVVLVGVAWAAVLYGLFLTPVSTDPVLDLEAGPSFAVNLFVYLPALALSVVLLVALIASLAHGKGAVAGAAVAVAVGSFTMWVLAQPDLLAYRPELRVLLLVAQSSALLGLLAFWFALLWPSRADPAAAVSRG